ncbi:MAG: hypothetical protein U0350_38335 [Caldilineaceae bacterium]
MNKQFFSASKRRSILKFLGALLLAITAGVINNVLEYGVSSGLRSLPTIQSSLTCAAIPFLDGKTMTEAYSVVLEIKNTSRFSINRQSYEKPLILILGNDTKVLAVKLLETQPDLLSPSYELGIWNGQEFTLDQGGHAIRFQPVLLNENDFFQYRIILDKPGPPSKVLGHVAGVKLTNKVDASCQ